MIGDRLDTKVKLFFFVIAFCALTYAQDTVNTELKTPLGVTMQIVIVLNDMYINIDTVKNVVDWRQSGKMWYLRTKTGEAWSDVLPKILKE